MKHIVKIVMVLIVVVCYSNLRAQELNCNVQINSTQVQGSDKSVFDAMQKTIYEF